MSKRNLQFALAAIRFGIFALVSVVVTYGLFTIMGGFGDGAQEKYEAVFDSASNLAPGDDVRVAGIIVGRVTDVKIHDRSQALVTFKVDKDVRLTTDTTMSVRFLNLIGDRYLALNEGDPEAAQQRPDQVIGTDRTTPALNLTELFNGFQPLFAALKPDEVNQLSMNIVQVLQGESGTVQNLLANTASVTNALADRDELIGQVIGNLNELMGTVDARHVELGRLISSLEAWTGGLAEDRKTIGDSLEGVSNLSTELVDLLTRSRPLLKSDVAELQRLLTELNKPENKTYLGDAMDALAGATADEPGMLAQQTRIGVYGSWYNYYLCEFRGGVELSDELMEFVPKEYRAYMSDFTLKSSAARCQ